MKLQIFNEIQFINEAILLAVQVFNKDKKTDENIVKNNLDFNKLSISEKDFWNQYLNFNTYFVNIMEKGKKILEKYKSLDDIFLISKSSTFPLTTLVYSKNRNSIMDYSFEEFRTLIRENIIENAKTRFGDFNYEYDDLEIIDKIDYLTGSQKFALVKLFSENTDHMKNLYNLLNELEQIIRDELYLVLDIFNQQLKKVDSIYLDKYKLYIQIKNNEVYEKLESISVLLHINNFNPLGFSVYSKDNVEYQGIVILGLLPLITKDYELNLEDKSKEIQERISILSEPNRFKIVYLLSKKEIFGQELAENLDLSKGSISQHLQQLQEKDIVDFKVDGRRIYYRLNKSIFKEIIDYLKLFIGVKDER